MIRLARLVDEPARDGPQQSSSSRSRSRSARPTASWPTSASPLYGTDNYPDATFTLRLAFGQVEGCDEDGEPASGLDRPSAGCSLRRGARRSPSRSPCRKAGSTHKSRLNLATPMNFVSTADIIGGNSGSPVVNRNGELVGIIFDGDLPSLVWDYVYTEDEGRAISVHGSAILEALRKIYDAGPLADELEGKSGPQ